MGWKRVRVQKQECVWRDRWTGSLAPGAVLPRELRGRTLGKSQTPGLSLLLNKGHGLSYHFTNLILAEESTFSPRKPYTESCFIS